MKLLRSTLALFAVLAFAPTINAADKKPNILFIMGDDIGWMQPSCYHRGLMVGETPNIDRLAKEGGDVHALLRGVELHCRAHRFHHRNASRTARAWFCRSCRARFRICALARRVLPSSCVT